MSKMLYLHILLADSTENWNAFCKLIVLDNYKISKKSKNSVLRYIENITGSVGNFVKCIFSVYLLLLFFCFVVAIFDLVRDVEAIFHLP